jgi:3-dehydroquinate synthase class II
MTDEASISVKSGGYEPRCKACNYPGHEEHDKALLVGKISDSDYAKIVGCTSKSVARHRAHIVKEIAQSAQARTIITADELFKNVQDEAGVVRELRDAARSKGDIELALKAVDRALKCIELYAKVQGIINDQPQINITLNAEWIALRTAIITALEPFPAAREVVVRAIRGQ